MLRMVLDYACEQARKMRDFLELQHQNGELYFGIHESDCSLMTCLVQGVSDGDHLHFIGDEPEAVMQWRPRN